MLLTIFDNQLRQKLPYPTEFPREDTPPLPPSSPTTLRGPTPLGLIVLGLALPHSGLLAAVVV